MSKETTITAHAMEGTHLINRMHRTAALCLLLLGPCLIMCLVASLVITVHDVMLTLDEEVEFIWSYVLQYSRH